MVGIVDVSLYHAALEHRDAIDPEVVVPSVGCRPGRAVRRVHGAPAESTAP